MIHPPVVGLALLSMDAHLADAAGLHIIGGTDPLNHPTGKNSYLGLLMCCYLFALAEEAAVTTDMFHLV
jgi:hypothetical protein